MKKQIILTHLFLWLFVFASFSQEQSNNAGRKPVKLFSFTEIGVLPASSDNQNKAPFIFHSSLNYTFFRNLSAGVGAGIEFYEETHLPVTANLMYRFEHKKIAPFVVFQAGYQIPLEGKRTSNYKGHIYNMWQSLSSYWPDSDYSLNPLSAKGGLMLNPSVGAIFYTESGLGITFSAGYRYQKLHYKGNDNYKLDIEYNRLSLKLGLIF